MSHFLHTLLVASAVTLCLAVGLVSCTRGPYWEFTDPPGLVRRVVEATSIAMPCGSPGSVGCYDRTDATIWIKSGMAPIERQCTISHEYHHAAGFTHPKFNEETNTMAYDCGDGTVA